MNNYIAMYDTGLYEEIYISMDISPRPGIPHTWIAWTSDVIISRRRQSWKDFMEEIKNTKDVTYVIEVTRRKAAVQLARKIGAALYSLDKGESVHVEKADSLQI